MNRKSVEYVDHDGKRFNADISNYPDSCLKCGHAIEPRFLSAYLMKYDVSRPMIGVVFQCPRNDCRSIFVGCYLEHPLTAGYYLAGKYMSVFRELPKWPQVVCDISPTFHKVFAQADVAESNGLDQVCGPGYRRALEFLVKDYLIHCGDDEATVRKSWLGTCVRRIKDERIKATATRATWLGNDETHYERLWENHDLQNLKDLIRLTVNWIESEELTKRYKDEMPGA